MALSPISPQEMFMQPLSRSREEKAEEEEEDDYCSAYHPYQRHRHLHTLVKAALAAGPLSSRRLIETSSEAKHHV